MEAISAGTIKFLRESLDFKLHDINVLKEQLKASHERRAALEEENEHLKAANSNGRFIQFCMKEAAEKAAAEHAALKDDYDQLKEDYRALDENYEALKEENEVLKENIAEYLVGEEDHEQLKAEHEQLKAEHEQLKKVSEKVYAKFGEERLEREIAADRLINFDDENYDYYWTATNGDVEFWKVPTDLANLPHPENDDYARVLSAFMDELFGDEWGQLSSFKVRTMTKQDLIDADGIDE